MWDLSQQVLALLGRPPLKDDVSPNVIEAQFSVLLGQFASAVRRGTDPYYIVVDGLERATLSFAGRSIPDLINTGDRPNLYTVVGSTSGTVASALDAEVHDIQAFGLSETQSYLVDLALSGEDVQRIHHAAEGIPVYLALVRERLVSGATVDEILGDRPPRFEQLLDREWANTPLTTRDSSIVAVIAFAPAAMKPDSVDRLAGVEPGSTQEVAARLPYLHIDRGGRVAFAHQLRRTLARNRLANMRADTERAIVAHLTAMSDQPESVFLLPPLLAEAGDYEGLRRLVTSEALTRALNVTRSLPAVRGMLMLAADEAIRTGDVPSVFGFALASGFLGGVFRRFRDVEDELLAKCALGDYTDAYTQASSSLLPDDRARGLGLIAGSMRDEGLTVPSELDDDLEHSLDQISAATSPEDAANVATYAFGHRPDLAIRLVERCAGGAGRRALDRALALLSLGTRYREAAELAAVNDLIEDESLRALVGGRAASSTDNVEEVLAAASSVEDEEDGLLILRDWCARNQTNPGAGPVLEKAYEWLTRRGDFANSLRLLRQLSEPLRTLPEAQARPLLERLTVLASTGYEVPVRERIRLELIMSETEYRWSPNTGGARLLDTYLRVTDVAEPEVRLEALAASLKTLIAIDEGDRFFGLQDEVRTRIRSTTDELLANSAEHYELTRRPLGILGPIDIELAHEIASSLNTQSRRNRAIADVVASAVDGGHRDSATFLRLLSGIDETDRVQGPALVHMLRACARRGVDVDADVALQLLRGLPDPWDRATGTAWLATICRSEDLAQEAADVSFEIDQPWRRRGAALTVVRTLAKAHRAAAKVLYDRAKAIAHPLEDPFFGPAFAQLLDAAIVSSGDSSAYGEAQARRTNDLIAQLPSPMTQAILLAGLTGRELYSDNRAAAERHLTLIRPLIPMITDRHARTDAITLLASTLVVLDRPLLQELLAELPEPDRASAIFAACVRALARTPIDTPINPERAVVTAEYDEIEDIIRLAADSRDDNTIYWSARMIAMSLVEGRGSFKRAPKQLAALASLIDQAAGTLGPSPRGIQHSGYRVLVRAFALRLRAAPIGAKISWADIVADAKAVPNRSDRVFVLTELAQIVHPFNRELAESLVEDARGEVTQLSSTLDYVERLTTVATALTDMAKTDEASAVVISAVTASQGLPASHSAEHAVDRLVELADSIDPDLAGRLSQYLEDDFRRFTVKERAATVRLRRSPASLGAMIAEESGSPMFHARVSAAADDNRAALASGRGNAVAREVVVNWLRTSMQGDLDEVVSVVEWALENARAAKWASNLRVALVDACLGAVDFALLAATSISQLEPSTPEGTAYPDALEALDVVRAGDRDRALRQVTDWLSAHPRDEILLVDPYFRPDDVLVFRGPSELRGIRIITGNSVKTGQIRAADDLGDDIKRRWRLRVDGDPPPMVVTVLGTPTGRCPIHDRFLVAGGAGLYLGSSLGGLGRRDTAIRELEPPEAEELRTEALRWLVSAIPMLDGERVLISTTTLPR